MKQISIIGGLFTLLFIASCSTSDNGVDPLLNILNPAKGSFSAKVNGEEFSTAYPFVAGAISLNSGYQSLAIGAVRTNATDTTGIALAFVAVDITSISSSQEFKGNNPIFDFWVAGDYTSNVHTADRIKASSGETDIASATITMIDTVNKKVSGTFSFTAKDPDTDITYQVTDGKFENVEY